MEEPSLVVTLAVRGLDTIVAGLAAAEGEVVPTAIAALVPWNPAWLVVSLWRQSLFLAVKYTHNSGKVLLATGRVRHISHAMVNMPVDSKSRKVKSRMAWLEIGLPPAVAMRRTSQRHSHNCSMGSPGDHNVAMLERLASSLAQVIAP